MHTIRVLIAEDSAVTLEYLVDLLSREPDLTVIGTACNGAEAVSETRRLRPDVVLMDARMPVLDGYVATRQIMGSTPTPIVVMTADFDPRDAAGPFAALEAGALTMIGKPRGGDDPRDLQEARSLVVTVRLMSEVRVVRRWHRRSEPAPEVRAGRSVRVVAIGASTGGPPAVAAVLRQLPKRVPVLVVQHIAPGFITSFAEWLRVETGFCTQVAAANQRVNPGTVYLAPEGAHMGVTGSGRIVLSGEPEENGFRPSICHLFRSVAAAFGASAAGVLLSGMGCDGAEGLRIMRAAGAVTFAQAEASCAVFGMPFEAIRRGAAQHTLAPAEIGTTVRGLLSDERGLNR